MKRYAGICVGLLMTSIAAQAANIDPIDPAQCRVVTPSPLLDLPTNSEISAEVKRLMDDAIEVSQSTEIIESKKHAFTWANEAKAACGIAYGYLRTNTRDSEFISKCDCFHQRMEQYAN